MHVISYWEHMIRAMHTNRMADALMRMETQKKTSNPLRDYFVNRINSRCHLTIAHSSVTGQIYFNS